ncbi:MAG: lactonase family protein [Spirochaetia bacterium]|nr:lactonase family protein [Spirochaetia bacterium]
MKPGLRALLSIFLSCFLVSISAGCASKECAENDPLCNQWIWLLRRVLTHTEPTVLYSADEDHLKAFKIDAATGAISATIPGAPFGAGNSPRSIAVDPSNRFLFVTSGLNIAGDIGPYGFKIQESGAVSSLSGSPFAVNQNTSTMGFSQDGNLYVQGGTDGTFLMRMNQETGALTLHSSTPFGMVCAPRNMVFHPSGDYLYSSTNGVGMNQHRIDRSTGVLTTIGPNITSGGNLNDTVISPRADFLYALSETNQIPNVYKYVINGSDGTITTPTSFSITGASITPNSMVQTPSGNFLYVSLGTTPDNLYALSVDQSTGTLNNVSGFPMTVATNAVDTLGIDPTGQYLYVATYDGTNAFIRTYRIQVNGSLVEVPGSPITVGTLNARSRKLRVYSVSVPD